MVKRVLGIARGHQQETIEAQLFLPLPGIHVGDRGFSRGQLEYFVRNDDFDTEREHARLYFFLFQRIVCPHRYPGFGCQQANLVPAAAAKLGQGTAHEVVIIVVDQHLAFELDAGQHVVRG